MITKNEKAKGLWWRLLATLPVLAILLIANTKVTAQEAAVNEQKDEEQATTVIRPENNGETTVYNISTTKDLKAKVTLKDADSIYQIVDQMPEFPGGIDAMTGFVASNIKYPQDAIDEGKEGRVFVSFVVEKDGWVSNVKVLKGVCESIDEEAARVVRGMPRWKPGMKDGKPARVSFQLPVTFKLDQMNNEHKTIVRTVIAEDESGKHSTKSSTATYPDEPIKDNMKPNKDGVYQIVEEMPRFPGDEKALMEYLKSNLQMPEKYKGDDAEFRLAEYRTFIRFVVTEDGSISDVNLIKKTEGFKDLDDEALRVVKAMPKWEPGKMGGKPVKVYFHLPVVFKFNK
jgi:TonB family protein